VSSPVLSALVNAELDEAEQNAIAISAAVAERIGPPVDSVPARLPPEFLAWCQHRGVRSIPARPASVALFVLENEALGIDALSRMVVEISGAHLRQGRSDPTSGYPVATALNSIAKIEPPRSWPKERKARFATLPYYLQLYVAGHEKQREATVSRAINEAAQARKELAAIQQPAGATEHGNTTQTAA
jgi:hypothetical protein